MARLRSLIAVCCLAFIALACSSESSVVGVQDPSAGKTGGIAAKQTVSNWHGKDNVIGWAACLGEDIDLELRFHVQKKVVVNADGTVTTVYQLNQTGTGTGLTTGNTYVTIDHSTDEVTLDPETFCPFTRILTLRGRVVSPGKGNNSNYEVKIRMTIDCDWNFDFEIIDLYFSDCK